ncbi:hypothetical protein L7F22_066878 [Adiantum nelumboides]|nr:hypothetical protein [Adiantum nelumboides]
MDFVTELPTIAGYNSVYVVVDMLIKVAHLMLVKTTYMASNFSRVFINKIFRLHGLPKRVLNNRDAKLTLKFWTSLFQAIGTQLCFSTAYHPQTDGQTERVNQVIEDILRAYCLEEPRKWVQHLPLVEYAYNSFNHRSKGMSPFKALYGQECIAPLNFSDPTIKVEASKKMLDEMDVQTKAIRKDIQAAQDRQKRYADKDRSERVFKLGDRVFFYLGFIISADGISIDPDKIKDIVEWPQPSSVSKVRGFLGITGWYRILVKDYALIAAQFIGFLKKGMRIDWKAEHEASFSKLKEYLVSSSILKLPNFSKEFEVVTDASGLAMGGVLTQEGRPVAYSSRKLRDLERNYPTQDLELLAVIHALKLWRHYLLSSKFQLVTDHKSLKWIFTQPNLTMRQRRWIELL